MVDFVSCIVGGLCVFWALYVVFWGWGVISLGCDVGCLLGG